MFEDEINVAERLHEMPSGEMIEVEMTSNKMTVIEMNVSRMTTRNVCR
jgi:hypothetical protein